MMEVGEVIVCSSCMRTSAARVTSYLMTASAFSSIQVFSWLNEAHGHYRRQSILLEVRQLRYTLHPELLLPSLTTSGAHKLTHTMNHHTNIHQKHKTFYCHFGRKGWPVLGKWWKGSIVGTYVGVGWQQEYCSLLVSHCNAPKLKPAWVWMCAPLQVGLWESTG